MMRRDDHRSQPLSHRILEWGVVATRVTITTRQSAPNTTPACSPSAAAFQVPETITRPRHLKRLRCTERYILHVSRSRRRDFKTPVSKPQSRSVGTESVFDNRNVSEWDHC